MRVLLPWAVPAPFEALESAIVFEDASQMMHQGSNERPGTGAPRGSWTDGSTNADSEEQASVTAKRRKAKSKSKSRGKKTRSKGAKGRKGKRTQKKKPTQ